MRRVVILAALALGALAIPSAALATHGTAQPAPNTQTCGWTAGQDVHSDTQTGPSPVIVYADTAGGNAGSSGQADTAAGACADFAGTQVIAGNRFDGGVAEAGTGTAPGGQGSYAVVDGLKCVRRSMTR